LLKIQGKKKNFSNTQAAWLAIANLRFAITSGELTARGGSVAIPLPTKPILPLF
jgi:hypothetical protein